MSSFWNNRWPLERILFALAGTVTLTSALLAATISPWFLLLTVLGVRSCLLAGTGDVTSGPTRLVPAERRIDS